MSLRAFQHCFRSTRATGTSSRRPADRVHGRKPAARASPRCCAGCKPRAAARRRRSARAAGERHCAPTGARLRYSIWTAFRRPEPRPAGRACRRRCAPFKAAVGRRCACNESTGAAAAYSMRSRRMRRCWATRFAAYSRPTAFCRASACTGPKNRATATANGRGDGASGQTPRGIGLPQGHRVPFNTPITVNAANMHRPFEVYGLLRQPTNHMQFLPVVDCLPARFEADAGQRFAAPYIRSNSGIRRPASRRARRGTARFCAPYGRNGAPMTWGAYMCSALTQRWASCAASHPRRAYTPRCAAAPAAQRPTATHTPATCLSRPPGNLLHAPLRELMEANRRFGLHQTYGLPQACFDCPYLRLCLGGRPKDRLCDGYRMSMSGACSAIPPDRLRARFAPSCGSACGCQCRSAAAGRLATARPAPTPGPPRKAPLTKRASRAGT